MGAIMRLDHVGITVDDLEGVVAFFVALGLELDGEPGAVEGHFVSTVVGIDDVRVDVAMLRSPDGGTRLELSRFVRPADRPEPRTWPATELGLRNICFEVDDVDAVVARLAAEGYGLVGGIAEHEGTYRMCYVRGPEQLIVSLAQDISVT